MALVPALTMSATELFLEPSGGKALLIDSDMLVKRSSQPQQKLVPESSTEAATEDNQKVKLLRRVYYPCTYDY